MSILKKSIFTLLSLALIVSFAVAQTPTGRITGKVTDEQGVALPGVSVEATSPRLVGTASSITDETGSLPSLLAALGHVHHHLHAAGLQAEDRKASSSSSSRP